MKGISLLEVIVTIAIVAILSLMSINTINNFKSEASMDTVVNELISEIRLTRSKSLNGELLEGETLDNFDQNGYPKYGIRVNTNGYEITRECFKSDASDCTTEPPIESVNLQGEYTLSPQNTYYFDRLTGAASGFDIEIVSQNGKIKRKLSVSNNFAISVAKI